MRTGCNSRTSRHRERAQERIAHHLDQRVNRSPGQIDLPAFDRVTIHPAPRSNRT